MNEIGNENIRAGAGQHRVTAGTLVNVDLQAEVRWLESEQPWQAEHTAHTIVKYPDLRIVLIAIKAGGRLKEHRTAGRVSIHALSGEFEVKANDQSIEMTSDKLLALDQNVPHQVEAKTNSILLLTIVATQ